MKIRFNIFIFIFSVLISPFCSGILPAKETNEIVAVIEVESVHKLINGLGVLDKALGNRVESDKIISDLSGWFGSPGLAGLDTNKPFHVFFFALPAVNAASSPFTPPMLSAVLVHPLKGDAGQYLESAGKSFKSLEKIKDTFHFSENVSAEPGAPSDLYVAIVSGMAIAGAEEDIAKIETIAELIKKDGAPVFPSQNLLGTVRICADIQVFMPYIESLITGIGRSSGPHKTGIPDAGALLAKTEAILPN